MSDTGTVWFDCSGPDPDQNIIRQAAALLDRGGIIAYPTETFYGLAADSSSALALTRLSRLKKRPPDKPFPLILSSKDEVHRLCRVVPARALQLMRLHWPGPLTLVLPAAQGLHSSLVSPEGGIGLRLSSHPLAHALAHTLGRAITATSANPVGATPVTHAHELDLWLLARIDGVLDGGTTFGGLASTILEVGETGEKILRAGPIVP